jgi:HrpA-like RNA helicase
MSERRGGEPTPRPEESPQREQKRADYPAVPMDEYRGEVVECVRTHEDAVIIGETGSGKTTRIPDFLLDAFPEAKIAITQPRRVAARSVSRFVAERRNGKIGDEVGYQVRFEDKTTEGTRANFMTDGILLRKLQYDPLLQEYDVVMVDEAHERSLNIDFVLGLLKRVQAGRREKNLKELKVIVTSATIEKEKFAAFFGDAPTVEVPGRMFPVEVKYENEPVRDYPKAAAQKVQEISASNEPGDILIFMPSEEDIHRTVSEIEELGLQNIKAMPLYGAMAPEDQDQIFEKSPKRKVIVSTNIAETSVTIDGVRFVIDSGLIKQKEFDPETGIEALRYETHAKSGCEQRKGRAGRTAPGVCYRLYTEAEYAARAPYQTPEISRSNLDHVILAMKKIGIDDVRGFEFIDPPKEEAVAKAIETLKILGALDDQEKLTEMGKTMAELPLRPELARMVIEADKYHCVGKICTIAAMMGERSIFVRPKGKELEADTARAKFSQSGSDFLTLLEVGAQWSASGFSSRWAQDNFLNVRQLFEVKEIRAQLMRELRAQGIAADDVNGNDPVAIQKCVAAGLIQRLMIAYGEYSYKPVAAGTGLYLADEIFIHPSSAAFNKAPRIMIGANVVTTKKTYARQCQPVLPEWLLEIAPQLLNENLTTARYDAESDTVVERIAYSLKASYGVLLEQERKTTNRAVAEEQFVEALTNGSVDIPSAEHNAETIRELHTLYSRSGGRVQAPDLFMWYKERATGIASKKEALPVDERLRINANEYCPPELRAEIDRLYPATISVQGRNLNIEYNYRPARPHEWSGEIPEEFKATIIVPEDTLFSLKADDFPKIGAPGRPKIVYRAGENWNTVVNADFEALKTAADNKRLENAWHSFRRPEIKIGKIVPGQALPPLESVGAVPVAYAKNFQGEDALAYPAYVADRNYDYDKDENVYSFRVEYFRTPAEAQRNSDNAMEIIKETEDAKPRTKKIPPRKFGELPKKPFGNYGYGEGGIYYSDFVADAGFGSILDRHRNKQDTQASAKMEKPTTPKPEVKPKEKEAMTEDLRAALLRDIADAHFFLTSVRAVPEPGSKEKNAEKISKVRARAAELRRDLNAVEQNLHITNDAESARGKVDNIFRRAERAAEEMAKLQNGREDWPDRFKTYMAKIDDIAKTLDTALSAAALEKIRTKVAALTRHPGEPDNLDKALEEIIIESI